MLSENLSFRQEGHIFRLATWPSEHNLQLDCEFLLFDDSKCAMSVVTMILNVFANLPDIN